MSGSSTRPGSLDYCATPLRAETAELLHDAGRGIAKLLAAALGVTRSRVDRQHAGEDANFLELLTRELDRIEIEAGRDRVRPILRWLAARYGYTLAELAAGDGSEAVQAAAVSALRDSSEAIADVLDALPDGIDEEERRKLEPKLTQLIERATSLREGVRRGNQPKPRA